MSERLDARLHGHGGGVEYEAFRALVGGILDREIPAHDWHACTCPDCARVLAVAKFVRHNIDRLASNPEPEDDDVREAVARLERRVGDRYSMCNCADVKVVLDALRSQAGQGRDTARLDWVLGELGNDFLLEEFKLWNPTKEQIMAAIDARIKERDSG